jgi:hypothetical protein
MLVLGLDNIAFFVGHQAMLEFPLNFFSLLALWSYLKYEENQLNLRHSSFLSRHFFLYLCAFALAAATLSRLNGIILIAALFLYLMLLRNWLTLIKLTFGAALAGFLLMLPTLITSGFSLVNYALFFQLTRSEAGLLRTERVNSYAVDFKLTVLLVCLGLGGWLIYWRRFGLPKPLLIFALWTSLTLLSLSLNSSFHFHYYIMLLPSLAVFASGIAGWRRFFTPPNRLYSRIITPIIALFLLPTIIFWLIALTKSGLDSNLQATVAYTKANSTPQMKLTSQEVLINLLAERPMPRDAHGGFMIDSYGYSIYLASGIAGKSWWDIIINRKKYSEQALNVINNPTVQNYYIGTFNNSDIIVQKENSLGFVAPETLAYLTQNWRELTKTTIFRAYLKIPQ